VHNNVQTPIEPKFKPAPPGSSRIPAMDDATTETVYDPASQDAHYNQPETFQPTKQVQRPKIVMPPLSSAWLQLGSDPELPFPASQLS